MARVSTTSDIQAFAQYAVEQAQERFNITLDYSEESIEQVEIILGRLHGSLPRGILGRLFKKQPSQKQLAHIAAAWGAYVGEVIRRRWGGEWTRVGGRGPGPRVALRVRGASIFPAVKVYKRLTQGVDDNVWLYYVVLRRDFERSE